MRLLAVREENGSHTKRVTIADNVSTTRVKECKDAQRSGRQWDHGYAYIQYA